MSASLERLNSRQKEAVSHKEGPLLIVAGAGAGKTRTLTQRVLALIEDGVLPERILAITFTNKAAGEMRERIMNLLETSPAYNRPVQDDELPFISTFHALGVHILRRHGKKVGISPHFIIFDRQDSLKALNTAVKNSHCSSKEWPSSKILSHISSLKNDGIEVDEYETGARGSYEKTLSRIWREYNKFKKRDKALDFDDLLLVTRDLLNEHPDVRSLYQNRWDYIHIDEFQDTNTIQYDIARTLAGLHKNICVVGDADQTIYTWRGAQIKNILQFEEDFPGTKTILLEENYRSSATILSAANDVISKNTLRKEKKLFTKKEGGEGIGYVCALDENFEARFIALKAKEMIEEQGIDPRDIAVLYRTNFQSRVLEEMCLSLDVPYTIIGTRFFERREVKDILSYIRLAFVPDSVSDLTRIIDVPKRGIGKVTLGKMIYGKTDELSPSLKKKVYDFRSMIASFGKLVQTEKPSKVIAHIIKETGIEEDLSKGNADEKERLENLKELVTLALKYDDMEKPHGTLKLIEDASLMSDQDELGVDKDKIGGIRLMTVHASKGLEFDYIFISGLEEGLFPQERDADTLEEEEEERRLFYVALTRARKKVILTHASSRTIFGSRTPALPSRFLGDISIDLFEEEEVSYNQENPRKTIEYLDINDL